MLVVAKKNILTTMVGFETRQESKENHVESLRRAIFAEKLICGLLDKIPESWAIEVDSQEAAFLDSFWE